MSINIHPKVVAAAGGTSFAEAVVVVVLWILSYWHIVVPDDVAAAFATILGTAFALIGGYSTSSTAAQQQIGN